MTCFKHNRLLPFAQQFWCTAFFAVWNIMSCPGHATSERHQQQLASQIALHWRFHVRRKAVLTPLTISYHTLLDLVCHVFGCENCFNNLQNAILKFGELSSFRQLKSNWNLKLGKCLLWFGQSICEITVVPITVDSFDLDSYPCFANSIQQPTIAHIQRLPCQLCMVMWYHVISISPSLLMQFMGLMVAYRWITCCTRIICHLSAPWYPNSPCEHPHPLRKLRHVQTCLYFMSTRWPLDESQVWTIGPCWNSQVAGTHPVDWGRCPAPKITPFRETSITRAMRVLPWMGPLDGTLDAWNCFEASKNWAVGGSVG